MERKIKSSWTSKISGILALACLSFSSISGQTNNLNSDDDIETLDEFVIAGIRGSLIQAREIKREANAVQDSIIAEDIAKFPDLNLAESLQRLPGVAINREAGEGRRVSLRGLGPDFTRVQLNGMEVLGNVDSPQDSRGQTTRDRAFDFNLFASELFSRVDVYKSFSAEQNEGGLAGTIGLFTAKNFDYDKDDPSAALSVQAGTNSQTSDFQPRVAGQVGQTWKNFGALLSVAYSSRDTEEQGYNTYRWRLRNASGSDISNLPQNQQDIINAGESRWARGNRLSNWQSQQDRLGLTGSFQWVPTETLTINLDLLYGSYKADREELHLASRGSSSTLLGGGTTVAGVTYPNSVINEIRLNGNNEVVYSDVSGANLATETRRQTAENEFTQGVLSVDWRPTDRLLFKFLVGTETSDYNIPISDKFYTETFGDIITDYSREQYYGYNTYGFDTTSPSNWRAHEFDFREDYQSSKLDTIKADLNYSLTLSSNLKLGVSSRRFENEGFTERRDNVLRSEFQSGEVDDDVSPYATVFRDHKDQDWLIADWDRVMAHYGLDREELDPRDTYGVEEETFAAYLQYDWDYKIGVLPFRGDIGIRHYNTTITSSGVSNVGRVEVEESYDDILPALNMVLELNPNINLRFAASENINRPTLSALRVDGDIDENNGEYTVSTGNPALNPYESKNIDLALEWYFGNVGYAAIGFFYKDITGFIGSETAVDVPYSETGLPVDLLPGLTPDTIISEYTRPVNYEDATLSGVELSIQSDLTFLPVDGFGVVANLTLVDSELDYASPTEQEQGISRVNSLEGMSDTLGNLTFYYENNKWGARISANYRSDWILNATPVGTDEDMRGYESTTYVDFSAFYQVTPRLKLTLDAINLTDTTEQQYSDSARRLYNVTTAGTTIFAGLNYQL